MGAVSVTKLFTCCREGAGDVLCLRVMPVSQNLGDTSESEQSRICVRGEGHKSGG